MILEANHISYTYRTQKNSPVLHQISAGFEAGKFYSIIGSSANAPTANFPDASPEKPPFSPFLPDWILLTKE